MKQITIGIDIGGTNTEIGLIDKEGICLLASKLPTAEYYVASKFAEDISKEIKNLLNEAKVHDVELKAIGIGAPNGNYYTGNIEYAPNLNFAGIVPLAKMLKELMNVPVFLTNDANAAAIGEMVFGAAQNMKNFIVITLGTGLGSGIVVNGQLVYGHDGFAGEMGHTIVRHNGRKCACGLFGCLETYVSATGIKRTIYQLLADYTDESTLRDIPFNKLTAKDISEAALKGDQIALEAFEYTGKILGQKLAETMAYLSPEAIFLFGGLAQAGDLIFKPTKMHMERNMLKIFQNKLKLLPSGITQSNAAILGAAALAWNELSVV